MWELMNQTTTKETTFGHKKLPAGVRYHDNSVDTRVAMLM
jgi:hypothetical protein